MDDEWNVKPLYVDDGRSLRLTRGRKEMCRWCVKWITSPLVKLEGHSFLQTVLQHRPPIHVAEKGRFLELFGGVSNPQIHPREITPLSEDLWWNVYNGEWHKRMREVAGECGNLSCFSLSSFHSFCCQTYYTFHQPSRWGFIIRDTVSNTARILAPFRFPRHFLSLLQLSLLTSFSFGLLSLLCIFFSLVLQGLWGR